MSIIIIHKDKNMLKIQDSNMNVPLDGKYLKDLNIQLKNRMSLSSPKHVNQIDKIKKKHSQTILRNL